MGMKLQAYKVKMRKRSTYLNNEWLLHCGLPDSGGLVQSDDRIPVLGR